MKNKNHILILFFFFGILTINAQSNYYYYYKGEKIYLNLDKRYLNIIVTNNFEKTSISNLNLKDYNLISDFSTTPSSNQKCTKLEFNTIPTDLDYYQKINSLKENNNITSIQPSYTTTEGNKVGVSSCFSVKLKNASDLILLKEVANSMNVEIIKQNEFMPLWYFLRCTKATNSNTLETANYFYETNKFAAAVPDFIEENSFSEEVVINQQIPNTLTPPSGCSNDANFNYQWNLFNSGVAVFANHPFTAGIDIKACSAWQVTKGSGVKVAIMDQGIDRQNPELINNLSPLSYDVFLNAPNQASNFHGDIVAGIIADERNTQYGSGVAPESKIIDIYLGGYSHSFFANGINWAWQNGADIINNSWGFYTYDQSIDDAFQLALTNGRNGLGTIIVASSGNNNASTPGTSVAFPANIPSVISVGAIDPTGTITNYSRFGPELDVVAPADQTYAYVTAGQGSDSFSTMGGTSSSCPHVSGVAALILSANPCLTVTQVRNIIESTCQKIGNYSYTNNSNRPNGTWNNLMGYGLVDANAAVQMAQQMYLSSLDLMIKDGNDDIGAQPNTITPYMWTSQDIWVRNYNDNGLDHQNPDYSASGNPNYINVRVINKSCTTSTGNEQLKVYWAKAATSLAWPQNWDGSITTYNTNLPVGQQNVAMGQPIGTITIPVLQAGQEVILKLPWVVPNPNNYSAINVEPWHFCLLARIEASNDPMFTTETADLNTNVKNNNNIAWKNVTVVDFIPNNIVGGGNTNIGGVIAVGNPYNEPHTFYLELVKEDLEGGKAIYDEAEVGIKMDEILYKAWERGGKEAQLIEATLDEKKKIVKGNNVILDNLSFNGNETGTLNLTFNFLTKELTEKTNFVYHVIQKDAQTGNVIGGETYEIKKQARPLFVADAGGTKDVDRNEPITISASQISEPAIYNWYDTEGNLIFTGKDLSVSTDVAKKYKLEVIATADGFKDYTEVEVKLKPSTLNAISPNPASNNVSISYKLNEVNSAYLMILGSYGTTNSSNNYILDLNSSDTNINISNYPNGFYTVALVCNGKILDAKTLVKQ